MKVVDRDSMCLKLKICQVFSVFACVFGSIGCLYVLCRTVFIYTTLHIKVNFIIIIYFVSLDGDLITISDSSDLSYAKSVSRFLKITLFGRYRKHEIDSLFITLKT